MKSSAQFLTVFFNFLNSNCEYAVLRNFEGLPYTNESRDIDIIIEYLVYEKIKRFLLDLIEEQNWKIVNYLNSDRLKTWVCGYVHADKTTELVQLDFFVNTSVYGIELLNAKDFLIHRKYNGKVYHVNKDYEFLDKYLYNRAVGANYSEKYKSTRIITEHSTEVLRVLKKIYGVDSVEKCDKTPSRKLLVHAYMQHPFLSIARFCRFEWHRLRNYFFTSVGFSIGFTGPDGSGKTTVIKMLIEQLGEVFRRAYVYYHFRPSLFGNLSEVAHDIGLKKEVDRDFCKPHRGDKTSTISSVARLLFYSLDYILGYFVRVKSAVRITRLVIFDRYYTDIICDSRRSRIFLNKRFLYWFGRIFIPKLDYNILLTAEVETILGRKQELDKEGIVDINNKIEYLKTKPGYIKVMNETSPIDPVAEILTYIFVNQHEKNKKRI